MFDFWFLWNLKSVSIQKLQPNWFSKKSDNQCGKSGHFKLKICISCLCDKVYIFDQIFMKLTQFVHLINSFKEILAQIMRRQAAKMLAELREATGVAELGGISWCINLWCISKTGFIRWRDETFNLYMNLGNGGKKAGLLKLFISRELWVA